MPLTEEDLADWLSAEPVVPIRKNGTRTTERRPKTDPADPLKGLDAADVVRPCPDGSIPAGGGRNAELYRWFCKLRANGADKAFMLAEWDRMHADGMPLAHWNPDRPDEVGKCADSACTKPCGTNVPPPPSFAPSPSGPSPDRPFVFVEDGKRHENVKIAAAALTKAGETWQRGGRLVHVARAPGEPPRIVETDHAKLGVMLGRAADWGKPKKDKNGNVVEWPPCDPPKDDVAAVWSDASSWDCGSLVGISDVPVLRPDGSLPKTPGWDAATGWLWMPGDLERFDVPDHPTEADARAALSLLAHLVSLYSFKAPEHRSVALASLLDGIFRPSVDVAPLILFDSSAPGTGKSKLAHASSCIATGHVCSPMAPTNEEEQEKRITALLMQGARNVLIDNTVRAVGGPSLDAVLTSSRWSGRVLSSSRVVDLPNRTSWKSTGVNQRVKGDLVRRSLHCRVVTDAERPEERSFAFDPVERALARRAELVRAVFVVERAHRLSGAVVNLPTFANFGEWSRRVREPLVWLGEPDPVGTQKELREGADEAVAVYTDVLVGWWDVFGPRQVTLRGAVEELSRKQSDSKVKHLSDALKDLVETDSSDPQFCTKLGYKLRPFLERPIDGKKLVPCGKKGENGRFYRCENENPLIFPLAQPVQ